jgi:hypothetical protein
MVMEYKTKHLNNNKSRLIGEFHWIDNWKSLGNFTSPKNKYKLRLTQAPERPSDDSIRLSQFSQKLLTADLGTIPKFRPLFMTTQMYREFSKFL